MTCMRLRVAGAVSQVVESQETYSKARRGEGLLLGQGRMSWQEMPPLLVLHAEALFPKGWRELLDLLITAGSDLSELVVDGFGSGRVAMQQALISSADGRL